MQEIAKQVADIPPATGTASSPSS